MVTKALVSVITPVYNGIRFLEGCIKNVIDQECPDCEHIIVDGGSTDGTVEIIREYAGKFPHIKWISEKDNGQSDAMNKGISMAGGKVLSFLNADDYYEPGTLRRVMEIFKSLPDPSLLVGNCNVWDDHEKLLYISKPSQISLMNILMGRFGESFPENPSAYFYHKSLHEKIGLYKIDEHYGMDLDFIIRAVQSAKVVYSDELYGNYRYLIGTKTYSDCTSGVNPGRVHGILKEHIKKLKFFGRLNFEVVAAIKNIGRIIDILQILRIYGGRIKMKLLKRCN